MIGLTPLLPLALVLLPRAQEPLAAPTEALEARALQAQLTAERRAWRARERELELRLEALEDSLRQEQELRLAREAEWLEFTRLLAAFDLPAAPEPPPFLAEQLVEPPDPTAERAAREAEARRARGREMLRALDALLLAEQVPSLDFLELGEPHSHEGHGVVGPVVARLLDDRGRLVGMLAAERLRLEVSRAARTVTLVLEEGYESRGGVRRAFAGGGPAAVEAASDQVVDADAAPRAGVRRIFLPTVDPAPWIEALPELVDDEDRTPRSDDGRWNLALVRLRLNELLRDASASESRSWRLRDLGGVVRGVLRDVQLVELDDRGRVARRLFADRLELRAGDGGVELLLQDGSQERSGRVAPFLDGRFRVLLPRADLGQWRASELPGLAAPPAPEPAVDR